jgi:DNA-binding NarL/FixJ family response regulator
MATIQLPPRDDAKRTIAPARITLVVREAAMGDRLATAVRATGLLVERIVEDAAVLRPDIEPDVILLGPVVVKDEAIRRARAAFPDAVLIAVLKDTRRHRVRAALLEGADGVVLLDDLERTLPPTLDAVRAGQLVVPNAVREAMAPPVLSTREKQILGMVVLGFTNGEIAQKLVLSESTIKSHLSSAFHKLGVRSRTEAAAMILDADTGLGAGILTISDGG